MELSSADTRDIFLFAFSVIYVHKFNLKVIFVFFLLFESVATGRPPESKNS